MMIDVHLSDGRTTLRCATRGQMVRLIKRDPELIDSYQAERCWIDYGQGEGFKPMRVQYLRKFQIGLVTQLEPKDADAFLAANAPELRQRRGKLPTKAQGE